MHYTPVALFPSVQKVTVHLSWRNEQALLYFDRTTRSILSDSLSGPNLESGPLC